MQGYDQGEHSEKADDDEPSEGCQNRQNTQPKTSSDTFANSDGSAKEPLQTGSSDTLTASDGTPDRDGATVSEEGCPPHGIGTAEDFDWLRRKLRNVVSQQTPNGNSTPHGQTGSDREPDWVSGICDHCDDRSGPPIVDKETGRCTKCWADHEEISR